MTEKFGRLALHMWTIDTTPLTTALDAAREAGYDAVELRRIDFKRLFDTGRSNAQVLDLIRASRKVPRHGLHGATVAVVGELVHVPGGGPIPGGRIQGAYHDALTFS